MSGTKDKRSVDMQIMRDWVEPNSRILDLGCGRGILLEYLKQTRQAETIGVDLDAKKIGSCVKRGINAYMGDMMDFMKAFPDKHFDHVICSRTLQELSEPATIVAEALRVSRFVTVGFVNHGYWKNRLSMFFAGQRIVNEVYPTQWWESRPANPLSIREFEEFCEKRGMRILRRVYLGGDWKRKVRAFPNLFCGYAIYELESK